MAFTISTLKTGLLCAILSAPVALTPLYAEQQGGTIERASGERLATAVGHYARTRTLILAAIKEFDKGMDLANANTLVDSARFRASLVNRAAELERVLDPQPRISKSGVKYTEDTKLLTEAKP